MAVTSASKEKIELPQSMDSFPSSPSTSKSGSDAGSESSLVGISGIGDPPDRNEQSDLSVNHRKDVEIQSPVFLRSEEYRQLFRLPPEEVLVRDFNCALQEGFLLQGHMYLFIHHICFYSNIFGFETKKAIHFHEVTCVRKAKTAAIFHNAIEIVAGGKKHFFASFLSRDEAYGLIIDGWSQHSNGAEIPLDRQDSKSESSSQDIVPVILENLQSFNQPANDLNSVDRNENAHISEECTLISNGEDDISASTRLSEAEENGEEAEPILNADCLSSGKLLTLKHEDADAPKIPEYYTMVTESKFPIQVEEFFNLFFSDDSINFNESFHTRCGDKDFRCTSWSEHKQFGHARNVSFQHPIKMYFGARFGNCQEVQKFRVYRNSHLVVETSQEINDVPYGDYFRVEGLWDVERDGDEGNSCCILRVYVYVAFSKKTIWKGKIEQSTVEECRDAYSIWINNAHELVKQNNLAEVEGSCPATNTVQNDAQLERHAKTEGPSEGLHEERKLTRVSQAASYSKEVNTQIGNLVQGDSSDTTSIASSFRESMETLCSYLRSQSHLPLFLVITAVLILLLMQLSIIVLLTRAPQVHLVSQVDYMNKIANGKGNRAEDVAWMERQVHHLRDEMLMVEARLEKMQHEHQLLKAQLQDFEHYKRQR